MMCIDDLRGEFADDGLDGLNYVQQGKTVKTIVRQAQESSRIDPQDVAGTFSSLLPSQDFAVSGAGSRRDAIRHKNHINRVTCRSMFRNHPTTAQSFIIGVRCDYQYGLFVEQFPAGSRPAGHARFQTFADQ